MKILNRLPYFEKQTSEIVATETVRIKPYQIMVWVSVGIQQFGEWEQRIPRMPALIDTGSNHNLSISHAHLVRWAGIQPESLWRLGTVSLRGTRVPLHAAKLWLHANLPGKTSDLRS